MNSNDTTTNSDGFHVAFPDGERGGWFRTIRDASVYREALADRPYGVTHRRLTNSTRAQFIAAHPIVAA